jgi:hypothetical protein
MGGDGVFFAGRCVFVGSEKEEARSEKREGNSPSLENLFKTLNDAEFKSQKLNGL